MGGCRPTAGGHHLYVFFWPDISGAGCPIPWEFKNMFFVFLDFNAANRGNSQTVALIIMYSVIEYHTGHFGYEHIKENLHTQAVMGIVTNFCNDRYRYPLSPISNCFRYSLRYWTRK